MLSSITQCFLIFNQLRTVHCMVRIKNATKTVDNILCEDAGLKAPDTMEKCGNVECPKWIYNEWSACRKSKCFAWHTALQKRDVNCAFGNESVSDKCDENEKPTTKQECYNELCKANWRVEQWSEVSWFTTVELFMRERFFRLRSAMLRIDRFYAHVPISHKQYLNSHSATLLVMQKAPAIDCYNVFGMEHESQLELHVTINRDQLL